MNSKLLSKVEVRMFENFVYFKEVTKLSSAVYYQMKEVNFSENVFDLMHSRNDHQFVKELFDLVIKNNLAAGKYIAKINRCEFEEEFLKGVSENVVLNEETSFLNIAFLLCSCRYDSLLFFIKRLVSFGTDIHYDEDTPLFQACRFGQLEVVKFLVRKGCKINSHGNLMLHTAIINNHLGMVKYLVENGANIFDESLQVSMKNNNPRITEYLINKGNEFFLNALNKNN